MSHLDVPSTEGARWDLVALGEVMLRLDPGEARIASTRTFRAWEGGGEYNVARGLRRCFGMRTAVVTALVDNPVGRLIEDLMLQGGVDVSSVRWVPDDGIGRTSRNGLNFTERGFGVRGAVGCSDRGNTATSQMRTGDIDWDLVFREGSRWFHTGGIFAALSATTADVAIEAILAARRRGAVVSYDLNYRASLWKDIGGPSKAQEVNRAIVPFVDVLIGNEEDFTAALGFEVEGASTNLAVLDPDAYGSMASRVAEEFANLRVIATTLRRVHSATRNDWGAMCWADGAIFHATHRPDLEILDRVGGGDSFVAGLAYGFLAGYDPQRAVEYGAAHGALAMTTPGDTSMASRSEVEALIGGRPARVIR